MEGISWVPQCTCAGDKPGCTERCLKVAEAVDCSIPSCQAFLDNICPTKKVRFPLFPLQKMVNIYDQIQQCSITCSKIWSCYCCTLLSGACDEVEVCPSCSAMECPDCSCCGDCCHCTLKAPECSHVTCLCFECGKSP